MPSVLPSGVDVMPKPDLTPPKPDFALPKPNPTPAKPDLTPSTGVGTPAVFTKPSGSAAVKPNVPESTPATGFDINLHEPKREDSYESISQEFYNTRRFAAALRAFNRNLPLTGGRLVEVPPIYILEKRYPNLMGSTAPVGSSTPASGTASSAPQWGPAGGKSEPIPARATGNYRGTYVVPASRPMTLKTIARDVLRNEQRWRDLYELNGGLRPEDVLPAGTEVKLPADVRP
jgi:hypothetical protein